MRARSTKSGSLVFLSQTPRENLKKRGGRYKRMYLQIRNTVTDVENKLMVTRGKRVGINWKIGIDIYIYYYV